MDKETLDIKHQIKMVGDMVGHEGWEIVSRALYASIEAAQHLSEVKIETPDQLFLELKSRKLAVEIIAGWLHDIAGTAQLANEQVAEIKESYIITREEQFQ